MTGSSQRTPLQRFGAAFLVVAAAASTRLAFLQELGLRAPYITFYPAVILAALYGGLWAGVLATVLSAFAATYFWIEPVGRFSVGHPADLLGLSIFLINGLLISGITEAMHRARARAQAAEAEVRIASERKAVEEELRRHRDALEELVKERTAELVEQSRQTEAFLKHSSAPLVFLDKEFNFMRVNDAYARVCAREVSDFAGHNHFVDYPSEELKGKFESVVRTKEPYTVHERPFVFPDHPEWGTTYWDLFINPILDGSGEIDFLVFSLNDVTKRKRAEEEALRTQKLESLRVLAGGIAHDLNNLMVAVSANAGLALSKLEPGSPAARHIRAMEDASDQVSSFSKQILSFTGKSEAAKEPVELNDVVRDTVRLVMASVSSKAKLECSPSEDLPADMAAPLNMQQVVMNLVINASEALGDANGTIKVSTGVLDAQRNYLDTLHPAGLPEGRYVYLEVSDTGCGMSPETRKRIFDPFYTTKFTGRGLGLSSVLGIVHGHGGAIGLKTEAGLGTTFRILLPVTAAAVELDRAKPSTSEELGGNGTILVVDDEEGLLYMAKEVLETYGYHVLTSADGTEAVKIFSENPGSIEAVVMDLIMPHVRGDQAAREIRKLRNDVNIIFLSGYHEFALDEFSGGPGRTAFLEKPYKVAGLLGAVRDIMRA